MNVSSMTMNVNTGFDPIRHSDFLLTIQRRHLRLPEGLLTTYREQEVKEGQGVQWRNFLGCSGVSRTLSASFRHFREC